MKSKLFLDVRDIKKNGFLLSHTVLPHILREVSFGIVAKSNQNSCLSHRIYSYAHPALMKMTYFRRVFPTFLCIGLSRPITTSYGRIFVAYLWSPLVT